MLIILDLDNTLFNTSLYKEDLSNSLTEFGVSRNLFFKIYQKLRKKNLYSHKLFLEFLSKEKKIDKEKVKNKLEKLSENFKKYLYPDTFWFLKKMEKRKARLFLFSFGDLKLQKLKIKKSELSPFFEKILVTDQEKIPLLKKIIQNREKVYFINDHPQEIKEVIENFKDIIPIRIKRKESKKFKNQDLPFVPVFSNLKEIEKYLRANEKYSSLNFGRG